MKELMIEFVLMFLSIHAMSGWSTVIPLLDTNPLKNYRKCSAETTLQSQFDLVDKQKQHSSKQSY